MMNKLRLSNFTLSLLLISIAIGGCFQSEYSKQVQDELAKGIRHDSLLLGLEFGDTRDHFFGRCFDLNKQRLITQGPGGSSVQYLFVDSLFHREPRELRLLFAPHFDDEDKISEMQAELSYTGWAPWNRALQSDSLKVKVIEILESWYGGNKFITANIQDKELPVKIDGNRRIIINVKDAQTVKFRVQDLLHPEFQHSISKKTDAEKGK